MPKLFEKKLNALSVRRIQKPGRHADGNGLYLNIERSGSKSWLLRVTVKGKARTIGLGSTSHVSLAEARSKAASLRKVAKDGGDPILERDGHQNNVPTFEMAARQVYEEHRGAWKNAKHNEQWITTMSQFAFPIIGDRRVDEINSADILEVLQPIWLTKSETARRVRQRMRSVLDWSIAKHYRETMNPVDAVRKALPKQPAKKKHFASLSYTEIPSFLDQLRGFQANAVVKLGLELLIHTAARTSEILGSEWDEIDFKRATWTIPPERMKANNGHRVPLSERSLALLKELESYRGKSPWIMLGRSWKKPMSNMVFNMLLRRMERGDITVHGFRSSFRDWTAERTSTPRDVCEEALAHQIPDKVERAYRRSDLFDKRRQLMDQWSCFLMREAS